jgi:sulfoxide reductase heme-binding subunit YedZ
MTVLDRINQGTRKVPAWVLYPLGVVPFLWMVYLALTNALGPEPVKVLEHQLGEYALQLVVLGLAITPLRRFAGLNFLKFRRAIGLLAFFYVLMHLLVWLFLDVQIWSQIWADILKRPYITIGMAAFVLMIPLALTSNNLSVRRLGANWRTLHKATYAVAILGAVHFVWLAKGFQLEPIMYLTVIGVLLVLRAIPKSRARVPA